MNDANLGPVVSVGKIRIVFDDASRLRWVHPYTESWTLEKPWPNDTERDDINDHLQSGGCVLVITDGQDIVTSAWPHELSENIHLAAHPADEMIEMRFDHFDWLPDELRHRGDRFISRERTKWSREPAILRPALTLDNETDFYDPGQVVFAMAAPGFHRQWLQREIVHYLEHIQNTSRTASRS